MSILFELFAVLGLGAVGGTLTIGTVEGIRAAFARLLP